MPDRFKVTKTEETDPPPDYLLEETVTGKLLNDLSDNVSTMLRDKASLCQESRDEKHKLFICFSRKWSIFYDLHNFWGVVFVRFTNITDTHNNRFIRDIREEKLFN
ncbi:hypothetical protein GQX74_011960 [Glossina fuscipes]|nr:hypothetical protein GQX74_011960 [Glossina fuscipes]